MIRNKSKYNSVKDTILSDRNSGFKNTAYAVAELIDNSIQSALRIEQKNFEVTLIVVEEKQIVGNRNYNRISEIHVFDQAEGMNEEVLGEALSKGKSKNKNDKGFGRMGRYGFGLYMSSISQCRKTEIHSWQKNNILKSWLDIDEITETEEEIEYVPVEKLDKFPKEIRDLLPKKISENGTIVSWKNLDFTKWKTADGLFNNVEDEIGRMYRYFINDGFVKIKFQYYRKTGGNYQLIDEQVVRPNDPLYQMTNTTCPAPWHNKPGFAEAESDKVIVNLPSGKKGEITLKFGIAKEEFRGTEEAGGAKPHGKHALKNNGVSFLRSGRELELNKSWNNPSESRWRWVNAEIHFEGSEDMDNFLKVPTNKQGADNLYFRDIKRKCDEKNLNEAKYMAHLNDTDQEEYICTLISNKIKSRLDEMVATIKEWRKGKGKKRPITGSAEDISSKYREKRKEQTQQDKVKESASKEKRLKAMMERLIASGIDEKTAQEMATIVLTGI